MSIRQVMQGAHRRIPERDLKGLPKDIKALVRRARRSSISAPTAEIIPVQERLTPLLKREWTDGSDDSIAGLVLGLAGLWEVSRKHIIFVRELMKMANKPDRRRLKQISMELYLNWFSWASDEMKTMKPELARFMNNLRQSRRVPPKRRPKAVTPSKEKRTHRD